MLFLGPNFMAMPVITSIHTRAISECDLKHMSVHIHTHPKAQKLSRLQTELHENYVKNTSTLGNNHEYEFLCNLSKTVKAVCCTDTDDTYQPQ